MDRADLAAARRLVVKIGTGVLAPGGRFDRPHLRALATGLAAIAAERQLVIVSSGAIALGMERLGWARRPRDMPRKQAAAAVGQAALVAAWDDALGRKVTAAQVLLTHDVVNDRRRFLHARHTFASLLQTGAVPVVNENDTVAVDEIRFGDNDALAAVVAQVVEADLLVILSDVDAVYDADPRRVRGARPVRQLKCIDPELLAAAGGSGTAQGTGGMATKLAAARRCQQLGIACVIGPGRDPAVVRRVLSGDEVGTLVIPTERLRGRRRWIAHAARARGTLRVDEGARGALVDRHRSLLASGIREVVGSFGVGDVVDVATVGGAPFARGLTRYAADHVRAIAGRRSAEIAAILGWSDGDEVIHRDDLVLMRS